MHYYSKKQTSKYRARKIKTVLLGNEFELYTASGVFSLKKIDKGTEVLIKNAIVKDEWNVLDLGCGYGVIGIALKLANPKIKLTMTDINERAVKLTMKNCKINHVEAKVFCSDLFEKIDDKFDTIICNPPIVAGRKLCFKIIEESKNYLKNKGLLQLVARHQKGGKMLMKKMEDVFGNVKAIAKKSGYRVYVSENVV